ncbi:MAG: sigma-70 family RNA polymerase sigma factor [Austwickia sp.]|nr:sigma-70 family RNA polymerase sigma factor [Austwickia sp.]
MRTPFDQVVIDHGGTVLRVCRAVLGAGPDAEDAWSETFLAALRAWPELPEDANVQAWLVRIASRKAIDVTRARARRPIPTDDVPEPPRRGGHPPGDPAGDPAARVLDLWPAVARLPERQRLAVAYHYLGGLTHAETAELIGGTAAAVRRASADGIATLRRTFSDSPRAVDDSDRRRADAPGQR